MMLVLSRPLYFRRKLISFCRSFYSSEDNCIEDNPFQVIAFNASGHGYDANDLFSAGKGVAGIVENQYSDMGQLFRNFTRGAYYVTCEYYSQLQLDTFATTDHAMFRNVYVSTGVFPPEYRLLAPTVSTRGSQIKVNYTARSSHIAQILASTPSHGYLGFDYGKSDSLANTDFECMVQQGFTFFLQRGYVTWETDHQGIVHMVDPNMCAHLRRADMAGLELKGVYVQPEPRHDAEFGTVVTSLKRELVNHCGAYADVPIFLSIFDADDTDSGWKDHHTLNRIWLEGFLKVCRKYFRTCGVLSSRSMWLKVFNEVSFSKASPFKDVPLWYSNDGSKPSYKDFYIADLSFGGWQAPSMKQFVRNHIGLCNMVASLDWYHE
jgi:hypothetical protein